MRLLHTVNSLRADHGGPSRSVPALVDALVIEGVEVRLRVTDQAGLVSAPLGVDIVHDHGLWLPSNHAAARAAWRSGVPLVISPRGMLGPWALAHRRWKKRVAWVLYQRRDLSSTAAVHATSAAEAEAARAAGIHVPIAVIPNGVDIPKALPPRHYRDIRRALFLSRLHPVKGLPMLIEAWARIRPAGWELVLAGPDEDGHRAEIEALIDETGLFGEISFLGPVSDDDKWALYRTANLFVLPTHSENFGLVIAEALAAGVPVLTTTGAPWRVLETEQCGWWTVPTVDAIAGALAAATELAPEALNVMGKRGHALVERDYSWTRVAVQMKELYTWLLGRGERPNTLTEDL